MSRRRLSRRLALAAAALAVLAGCGGDGERSVWRAPAAQAPDGTVSVAGFDEYVEKEEPELARSPVRAAATFVLGTADEEEPANVSIAAQGPAEGGDERVVRVTLDRLADDSVRAMRYVLRFERAADGTWRLRSATWSQRCQPGRGHQAFTAEGCV